MNDIEELEVLQPSAIAEMERAQIDVHIEGHLIPLQKALKDLQDTKPEETDEYAILKQLREREAVIASTPKDLRIASIIATPALRKAVKEFGEKLLATPTSEDKAAAIEVGGAR